LLKKRKKAPQRKKRKKALQRKKRKKALQRKKRKKEKNYFNRVLSSKTIFVKNFNL